MMCSVSLRPTEPTSSRAEVEPIRTKLGIVSLGCDKNTVDSERIVAALAGYGAESVPDLAEAEVIIVNTCGFIDAAKQESVDTLLEVSRYKDEGRCRAVVALGCLVEQYREELEPSLPEIDLFVGLRDTESLIPRLRDLGLLGDPISDHPGVRVPLTDRRHVRYLKVSEGCDHGCAFCAIPLWRGKHRSFGLEALVAEAVRLEAQGTVELNLVAQDLAHFGREWRDGSDISTLLRRLIEATDIPWFRLLYIYSAGLRDPLIELMAAEPRLLPYIDMPIQHAVDPVLKRMRRPERAATIRARVERLRASIPDLTLRTTVLVGFPGETEDDFRALLDFLEEVQFDRLGAFAFSPQEGTRAAGMDDDFLPEGVAGERLEELLEVQRAISSDRLTEIVRSLQPVIVDRVVEGRLQGRTAGQADDVDGVTWLAGDLSCEPGTLCEARITAADDYDLEARIERIVRTPSLPASRTEAGLTPGRRLPLAPIGLEGGFGR
jgi:ribosomal protein S12 methylthiotransferase